MDRGEEVTLQCTYRSNNQGRVRLIWPSFDITPTVTNIDFNTVSSAVTFTASDSTFAQDYQCQAFIQFQKIDSHDVNLIVNCKLIIKNVRLYSTKIDFKASNIQQAVCTICLLYTSPSPRDATLSRMPSSA